MGETYDPSARIAEELSLPARGVTAVVGLLADGSTVPFIARYRKEATGSLDEVQIRDIQERRDYLVELESRRATVLESIEGQGKLSDELRAKILACMSKTELEDLYLPYKPKRRTRATIARERGLEPLAERIAEQPPGGNPLEEAAAFVDPEKEVPDADAALAGARDIVAEWLAENAVARGLVRKTLEEQGIVVSRAAPDVEGKPTKFEQYYDFREAVRTIPSHRFLAIRRGESKSILRAHIEVEADPLCERLDALMGLETRSPFAEQMRLTVRDGYKRLLGPSVETDVRIALKLRSDTGAVDVFADNLRNLLMAAPLGIKAVIGIDPGLRSGCKCAAIDSTGKFLGDALLHLTKGEAQAQLARDVLLAFVQKFSPAAIAVGNGTGGREAESFTRKTLADADVKDVFVVPVSEAGASVYSASDVAREEFPDLDLTVRGAISIARRLQDPLSELVKIDPKAIGVGQYQHDVHQPLLQRKLDEVVESCVNGVGVELNTTSAALLARVSGIGASLAKKVIKHREQNGAFQRRDQLLDVSGLGSRAFEQAAGFLRVSHGDHPLDASAVHPERYQLVKRIADDLGVPLAELVGNAVSVDKIDSRRYVSDDIGLPTLQDIVAELKKPGRDPRSNFEPPRFRDDVQKIGDLKEGMRLQGVVTNVTAFGAFVDVGVHQDGLVHVSQLADRFVKDPKDVVSVGDKLEVTVLEVDLERTRISLSARSPEQAKGAGRAQPKSHRDKKKAQGGRADKGGRVDKGGKADKGGTADKGGRVDKGGKADKAGAANKGGKRKPRPKPEKFTNNPFESLLKR